MNSDKEIELRAKIKPTNFRFLGSIQDRIKKDKNGNNVCIPTYTNGGFIILYDKIIDKIYNKIIKFNPSTLRVLIYFAKHIDFNTNWIKVTQKEIATALSMQLCQVNTCLHELQDMRLIDIRTHSEIIINHNYIFKGDMTKFYNDYKELYPDQEGEIF